MQFVVFIRTDEIDVENQKTIWGCRIYNGWILRSWPVNVLRALCFTGLILNVHRFLVSVELCIATLSMDVSLPASLYSVIVRRRQLE